MFLNEVLQEAVSKAWQAKRDKNRRRIEVSRPTAQSRRIPRTNGRLSEDEITTLIQEYEDGATQKELAVKWGVGRTTIIALFKRLGVEARGSARRLDEVELVEAAALYRSGITLVQLGEQLGIGHKAVRRQLAESGVRIRQPGRRAR